MGCRIGPPAYVAWWATRQPYAKDDFIPTVRDWLLHYSTTILIFDTCELKARTFSLSFESFAEIITHKRVLLGAIIIRLFLQEMNGAEYCLRSYRLIFVEFRVLSDCCLSCHWFVDKNAPDNSGKGGGGRSWYFFLYLVKYFPFATLI
jgi:hypothetical protein